MSSLQSPPRTARKGLRVRGATLAVLLVVSFACAFTRGAGAQQIPFDDNPEDSTEPPPRSDDAGVGEPAVRVISLVPDASAPLAQGRSVRVTVGDLARVVSDAPEVVQRQWASDPQALGAQLDRLVSDRLLVEEARRRGLESDPLVRAALERALISRLRATVINPPVGDETAVTPDEVRRFYDAHPERFHIPERRRAWLLFVRDRRTADEVLRAALPPAPPPARRRRRGAHSRPPPVARAANFRELIARYNTSASLARTDGELVDVTREQPDVAQNIRDALFSLERAGEVFPRPLPGTSEGVAGYYVLRLGGRRAPIERTLEQSAEWIRRRLVLQRRVDAERALVERLAQAEGVTRVPVERALRLELVDAGAPHDGSAGDARSDVLRR